MSSIGIVVSGGPAPGINTAIAAVTIEAKKNGLSVFGLKGGFEALNENHDPFSELNIPLVTTRQHSGGSILGTSRFNPLKSEDSKRRLADCLRAHAVDKLVIIGGEGSAYVAHCLSLEFPWLSLVHLPKTIDNDLILPNNYPSFGYETARFAGEKILRTLFTDAVTTERWFIVNSMGRKAGFLALGLGLTAGATITLIPEEFEHGSCTPDSIADLIMSSVRLRAAQGKKYGLALMAEGILDKFDIDRVPQLRNCPRDELGRIHYPEVGLEELVAGSLRRKCAQEKLSLRISTKDLGYELRCHDPIPFEIEYTKFLGFGAVRYLLEGKRNITVVRDYDNLGFLELKHIVSESGAVRSRTVDLKSDLYRVGRSFMIR